MGTKLLGLARCLVLAVQLQSGAALSKCDV